MTSPADRAPSPSALLALARVAALDAAEHLRVEVRRTDLVHESKSTATDMVTEVDRATEQRIVSHLLGARPDDGVLGEEGGERVGVSGVRWVVDPLDGTTNFLYGLAGFGVSIAAEVRGEVVAACVVDPLHDDVFEATLRGGATCNGRTLVVNDPVPLHAALVGTGFAYDAHRRGLQAAVLTHLLPEVRDIRRLGAAAVDLCHLAAGRIDAFYERGLGPWDLAAGTLVAAEAGAVVTDLDGEPPSGEFVLAAGAALHEPLRQRLRSAGAGSA